MGYRSDVRIAMYKTDFNNLMKELEIRFKDKHILADNYTTVIRKGKKSGADIVIIGLDDVKWYDFSYKDVGFITDFLAKVPSKIAILGEDISDIEVNSYNITTASNDIDEDIDSAIDIDRRFVYFRDY